ncbi:hypothetical protein Taro_051660 [Colocasia esculenta]|uniref:Uncharacterized protein n=1 Tax=Colocasia esculenta TaxID=4460 RepID=A0A843XHE6_COLES|nr:hypothetical protein [Colocasia esculenta]
MDEEDRASRDSLRSILLLQEFGSVWGMATSVASERTDDDDDDDAVPIGWCSAADAAVHACLCSCCWSLIRLASGLKIAHQQLGNIQLVSQFLTILGSLALQLHDTGQAREILKSALTLAKTLYDIPTQIWIVSVLTDLYKEVGERGNEMENAEYERKKEDDLQRRLSETQASIHHLELIEKARVEVQQPHGLDIKRAIAGPATKVDLDIPESVGLQTPAPSLSRLRDSDSAKRGKRKL